jgi:hypothetical protein
MKLNAILFSLLILFSSAAMANGPWVEKEAPQEFPAEVFVYPNPSNGVFYVGTAEHRSPPGRPESG